MTIEPEGDGPAFALVVATDSDLCDLVWAAQAEAGARRAIRVVRGAKAETWPALFDEFAAALQFPYYFGENGAAFDECLADLEWLPAAEHVVVVSHAARVLAGEPAGGLETWLGGMGRVAAERADRGGPALRVVLHATPADAPVLRSKLAARGIAVDEGDPGRLIL